MARVAWLHTHMKNWGGGSRAVVEVARRLARKHDLTLLIGPTSQLTEQKLSDAGVAHRVHKILSTSEWSYWASMPFTNSIASRRLARELNECDAVITSYPSANMIANKVHDAVMYYCWEPFTLFYNKVAMESLPARQRFFFELAAPAYRRFDLSAARRSRMILTIDNYTSGLIRQIYGRNSGITRMGVDAEFFRPVRENPLLRRYSKRRVLLSQTHGYSSFDGCEYLLNSVASLKDEFPTILVIFTSSLKNPGRMAYLSRMADSLGIGPNVEFLGFVEEGNLPLYYSVSEVVVQPATSINTMLTTKEAMACERPVVLFEGGAAEDIQGGDCGFVVPNGSVEGLTGAIRAILRDNELGIRLGKNGRSRALSLFSWDAVARNVADSLEVLLSGKPPA